MQSTHLKSVSNNHKAILPAEAPGRLKQVSAFFGGLIKSISPIHNQNKQAGYGIELNINPKEFADRTIELFSPGYRALKFGFVLGAGEQGIEFIKNLPGAGAASLYQAMTPSSQNSTPASTNENLKPPSMINTPQDLAKINTNKETLGGSYTLEKDIDATGLKPLGNQTHPFTGSLDAKGHAVKTDHCLVGTLADQGRIENVQIKNSHLDCNAIDIPAKSSSNIPNYPKIPDNCQNKALVACEISGNSAITNTHVSDSSVNCKAGGATCALFVGNEVRDAIHHTTPQLSNNSVSNSHITVEGDNFFSPITTSVGVAKLDIVVGGNNEMLSDLEISELQPIYGGIELHNDTISNNNGPIQSEVKLGAASLMLKNDNADALTPYTGSGRLTLSNDNSPVCNTTLTNTRGSVTQSEVYNSQCSMITTIKPDVDLPTVPFNWTPVVIAGVVGFTAGLLCYYSCRTKGGQQLTKEGQTAMRAKLPTTPGTNQGANTAPHLGQSGPSTSANIPKTTIPPQKEAHEASASSRSLEVTQATKASPDRVTLQTVQVIPEISSSASALQSRNTDKKTPDTEALPDKYPPIPNEFKADREDFIENTPLLTENMQLVKAHPSTFTGSTEELLELDSRPCSPKKSDPLEQLNVALEELCSITKSDDKKAKQEDDPEKNVDVTNIHTTHPGALLSSTSMPSQNIDASNH